MSSSVCAESRSCARLDSLIRSSCRLALAGVRAPAGAFYFLLRRRQRRRPSCQVRDGMNTGRRVGHWGLRRGRPWRLLPGGLLLAGHVAYLDLLRKVGEIVLWGSGESQRDE